MQRTLSIHIEKGQDVDLNDLRDAAHENACDKGWWTGKEERQFTEIIALLHSEVSEALEAYRSHGPREEWFRNVAPEDMVPYTEDYAARGYKPEGVPSELADIIIRVLDVAGAYDIDIERAVRMKMAYNRTRPYRHGGKRA